MWDLLYSAPTKHNPTNGYLSHSAKDNTAHRANLQTNLLYLYVFLLFLSCSGRAPKQSFSSPHFRVALAHHTSTCLSWLDQGLSEIELTALLHQAYMVIFRDRRIKAYSKLNSQLLHWYQASCMRGDKLKFPAPSATRLSLLQHEERRRVVTRAQHCTRTAYHIILHNTTPHHIPRTRPYQTIPLHTTPHHPAAKLTCATASAKLEGSSTRTPSSSGI